MNYVYKFVRHDPEFGFIVDVFDPNKVDVLAAAELRGWHYSGPFWRPACRDELQGHPVFSGVNGPMYDGNREGPHVIRYEGPAAYDRLSA
jgi:hypothetical protein